MKTPRCLLLAILVAAAAQSCAQGVPGLGFSLAAHSGGIIVHTEKLSFEAPDHASGLEAGVVWHTYGRQDWAAWRGHPVLGLQMSWIDLGTEELGHALAVYPFIDLPLYSRPLWKIAFRVGCGVGWVSRPYDRLNNPANNGIGSPWNAAIPFRWLVTRRIGREWALQGGLTFTHFSNGAFRLPNYGINLAGVTAGVVWTPRPYVPEDLIPRGRAPKARRKWGLSAYGTVAWKEMFTVGGPQHRVYAGSLSGLWQLDRINRLMLGVEYEFHEGLYDLARLNWAFDSESDRRRAASRLAVYAGEEFLFGPLGLSLGLGAYVGDIGADKRAPVYSKLGLRWHFPSEPTAFGRLHVGVYLKAHLVTADYFGLGLGYTLD